MAHGMNRSREEWREAHYYKGSSGRKARARLKRIGRKSSYCSKCQGPHVYKHGRA